MTPGATAGRVTVKKTLSGGAPQTAAAASSSSSSAFAEAATAQIMKGRLTTQSARPTGQSEPRTRNWPNRIMRPKPEATSGTVKGRSR